MTDILNLNKIQLILIFIIPGFISYKIWTLIIPSRQSLIKDIVIDIMCYSSINFALLIWLIDITSDAALALKYLVYIIIFFLAPILWPILWSLILKSKFLRGKTIHPTPKAWDYYFSLGKPCFMLIHLNSGKLIGGLYYEESFASSYPENKDLYLKEVWKIDENGAFLEKVEDTAGLLISYDMIEYIELFDPYPKEGDEDGKDRKN